MDFTSAYKNFGGNLSTQDYKMPEDFNIFGDLSSGALQATSAMNSAQMGKKNSNSLQDAFASVTKGISSEFKPVTEEEARIAGEEMRKSMKAQGLYMSASGAITRELTPVEKMSSHQYGLQEGPSQYTSFARDILTAKKFLEKGITPPNAKFVMGWSGSRAGEAQTPTKSVETGSKEYYQKMAEGTLPGFGSLTEYQKQTALGNVRTIEAQERAAAEEAKKKQKEQQEQQATSPQPKFSFQQQMTEQEYGSGVSVLQGLGMWQ